MPLPLWDSAIRAALIKKELEVLYSWWQKFQPFMQQGMDTAGDITFLTPAKGIVLTTPDGTKKYRVSINNAGAVITTLIS